MSINTRKKGSAFEYKVRDYLRELGCFVTRSTVSRFPDLIVIMPITGKIDFLVSRTLGKPPLFVECKSNKYLNKTEKQQLKEYKERYDIIPFVAYPRYSVYSKKKGNIILDEVK